MRVGSGPGQWGRDRLLVRDGLSSRVLRGRDLSFDLSLHGTYNLLSSLIASLPQTLRAGPSAHELSAARCAPVATFRTRLQGAGVRLDRLPQRVWRPCSARGPEHGR